MKVLLVNLGVSNIYSKLGANISPSVYTNLASFAKEGVHKVQIIDLNINKKALDKTDLDSFDLIGITSNAPCYFEDTLPSQNLDSLSFPARDLSSINKYKSTLGGITQIFLLAEVVYITVIFMLHQNV